MFLISLAFIVAISSGFLIRDIKAATPNLTYSNKTFYLGENPITNFGLRVTNSLLNDTVADRLISNLDSMKSYGIQSVSISLQGARADENTYTDINAFNSDGSLNSTIMNRLGRILSALDSRNMVGVVIYFYQAKDQTLANDTAVLNAAKNATKYLKDNGFNNVWLNVINEPGHGGFDKAILVDLTRHPEIYNAIKSVNPNVVTHVSSSANDGFSARTGTTSSNGNVVIEYARADEYSSPGVFTSTEISTIKNNAASSFKNGGYWFWHAAWHQKADNSAFPRFDKGGNGTFSSPGVAFIWDEIKRISVNINATPLPTQRPSNSTVPSVIIKPGDANGDGKVNIQDYTVWLSHFGQNISGPVNGDFNNNGKVDGIDFVTWFVNYTG